MAEEQETEGRELGHWEGLLLGMAEEKNPLWASEMRRRGEWDEMMDYAEEIGTKQYQDHLKIHGSSPREEMVAREVATSFIDDLIPPLIPLGAQYPTTLNDMDEPSADDPGNGDDGITCAIHCKLAAKLNLAAHESAFPALRELAAENMGGERLEDLLLTLESSPPFAHGKTWQIDRIEAGTPARITDHQMRLNGDFLRDLTETVQGEVRLRLEQEGAVLAESKLSIELLAANEWGGVASMPELLAAFCMPNAPAVDGILRSASEVLRQAGKPDALDGYRSGDRQRVWEMASAIYTAIANLGLSSTLPPASFVEHGQKVRPPSRILEGKVITCLDAALLFAAVFEQAGLRPLIALPKEHAMVGVWLQPEELAAVVVDDAVSLRKRIDLHELLLIETTLATRSPAPLFSHAIDAARHQLRIEDDDSFVAAIDIRQARMRRIRPLGVSEPSPDGHRAPAPPVQPQSLEVAPLLPDFDTLETEDAGPQTAQGRFDRWQRKLLDLSTRNPLLNHRSTRTSMDIICPDPGLLEDKLADGAKIQIEPCSIAADDLLSQQPTDEHGLEVIAREKLAQSRVLVDLLQEELRKRTVDIYRRAQTALQEGGANTLYLALGFLLWRRNERDAQHFRAPLILLPVALERRSVRSGVRIIAHDDEPRFNATLLEMLRRDFGLNIRQFESELPEDESGIDVSKVWDSIRQAVRDEPRLEVVEDVTLAHFSFAKYLMWKDLDLRGAGALLDNKVVGHLLTRTEAYVQSGRSDVSDAVDGARLDDDFAPHELLTPLPADASQMAVIATAHRGKDFVIEGPPGTGKSQTIANLIAHSLGTGKTVLFVSEKTAALEVVHRRLHQLGLDRFCLELHSNKARKADVLKQLRTAWGGGATQSQATWQQQASALRQLRDGLNRFVRHMHKKWPNGYTPHRAIGVKVRDEELAARVSLSWPTASHHDEAALAAMRETVESLAIQASALGDVASNPLAFVKRERWTPAWERDLAEQGEELLALVEQTEHDCTELAKALDVSPPSRLSGLIALGRLAGAMVASHGQQVDFALAGGSRRLIDALATAVGALRDYAQARASLSCGYPPFAWRTLDGAVIRSRWAEANNARWPLRWFKRRAVLRELRSNGATGVPQPLQDAEALSRLRLHGETLDRLDGQLSSFQAWQRHDTNPEELQLLQVLGERLRKATAAISTTPVVLADIRQKVQVLVADGDSLAPDSAFVQRLTGFRDLVADLARVWAAFAIHAGREPSDLETTLERVRGHASGVLERRRTLRDWCAWLRSRSEVVGRGLLPLVKAVEDGRIPAAEILATFEAAYCAWWSEAVMTEDDVLRKFSTAEHEAKIRRFGEVDERYQKATSDYIAARLQAELPDQAAVEGKSGWGVIRRELQKQRRHKPVRVLLKEASEAMMKLTPCFMMSPLSVAQYLPADQSFDVVIFDEASQITVWDAIGPIAHGRQVIVAGDQNQMPPTNFFARSDDDAGGDVEYESDLESILDEMIGAGLPKVGLNLHYRSRRESLIAFSNARYYDNKLITFPAPDVEDCGVSLRTGDGFYARGGARHNEAEAKAVVAEIVRRLTHQDERVRRQSIGVVTFNSEQQALIEDLLDRERDRQPEIEFAFSPDESVEPVFVKNLETVQGDERDVILFSVTYGPDQSGHVSMTFGPLNHDGGWRRLNVAITRSKSEMVVFSTLRPEHIVLSGNQARAVADLKNFLDYAARGAPALGTTAPRSIGDAESPFEVAVAEALRRKGWEVKPQIGVSAYRIDLGVVHPDYPGRYLAGVECDGATYHSSADARTRDKIRQQVLEGLGWTLIRVWSTDWWTDKARATEAIDRQLRACLKQDRLRRAQQREAMSEAEDAD